MSRHKPAKSHGAGGGNVPHALQERQNRGGSHQCHRKSQNVTSGGIVSTEMFAEAGGEVGSAEICICDFMRWRRSGIVLLYSLKHFQFYLTLIVARCLIAAVERCGGRRVEARSKFN